MKKKHSTLKKSSVLLSILIISTLSISLQPTTSMPEWDWGGYFEISFNCKHPILSNPQIREALSYLADREASMELMPIIPYYISTTINKPSPRRFKCCINIWEWISCIFNCEINKGNCECSITYR